MFPASSELTRGKDGAARGMDHRGGRFGGCGGAGLGWGGRCFPGFSWRFLGVKGHLPPEGDRDHGEGCWILFASNSCLSLMFLWSLASSGTFICVFLGGWTWHPAISTGTYAVWGLTKLGQWLFCVVLLVVWNPRDYRYMRFFPYSTCNQLLRELCNPV